MKHFTRWVLMLTILMTVFVCFPTTVHAQQDPCTDPLNYCPIDGGLYALLAVGVGFGIKKARDAKKNSTQPVSF